VQAQVLGAGARTRAGTLLIRLTWGGRVRPSMVGVLGVYLILVLLGATTSSLGIAAQRQDPAHPRGVTFGSAQAIRSDEWLTEAPLELGVMASGGATVGSPLAQHIDLIYQIPTSGFVGSLVFFDGAALKLGPHVDQNMLFAAYKWFPFLLLLLFLPLLLQRFGSTKPLSWFGSIIFILSPVSVWWSFMPIRIISFTVAGCYLLTMAVALQQRGRRTGAACAGLAAIVLLSRMATYYVPWAVTLCLPIVLVTVIWLVWPVIGRRSSLLIIGSVGVGAVLLAAALFAENLPALHAELGTLYPGQRRSGSSFTPLGQLLGAPSLFDLGRMPILTATNASEIATGFTFCALWLAVLIVVRGRGGLRGREGAVILGLAGCATVWLCWVTVPTSSVSAAIPVLNLVPSYRAAQTVGLLLILLLPLVLSRFPAGRQPLPHVFIAAGLSAAATATGGLALRSVNIKSMSVWSVAVATLAVFVLVWLIHRRPTRTWPLVLAVAVVALPAVQVNPLIFGLGDLRDSPTAQRMLIAGRDARAAGSWWATDAIPTDALLNATGVPSLSGKQVTGPVWAEWEKFDPTDAHEQAWNRGASYLTIRWTVGAAAAVSAGPNGPIVLSVDPCDPLLAQFNVRNVMSAEPLEAPCLVSQGSVTWQGNQKFIYQVRPA